MCSIKIKFNKSEEKPLLQLEFLYLNIYMSKNVWEDIYQHANTMTLNDVTMVDTYFLLFVCIF